MARQLQGIFFVVVVITIIYLLVRKERFELGMMQVMYMSM